MNDMRIPIGDNRCDPLEGSLAGDVDSFELLVRRHQPYAYALAMKFLADSDEAVDVVQEAFVRVWKNLHHYDPDKKFTTWLYKIVANLCVDRLRSLKRSRRFFLSTERDVDIQNVPDVRDWSNGESLRQLLEIIQQLAGGLPPKQRLVFTLRDLQDLSVEEVADIAELSIASVKTNLHYARKAMREMLRQQYGIVGSDV